MRASKEKARKLRLEFFEAGHWDYGENQAFLAWQWRLFAPNGGDIIACSSAPYTTRKAAMTGFETFLKNAKDNIPFLEAELKAHRQRTPTTPGGR